MRTLFLIALVLSTAVPTFAQDEEVEIFDVVEQEPELIGGIPALQQRVDYPEMARRAGIEGTVYVQFVVDEQGEVTEAVCVRTPHEMLCDAALVAVETSRFRPGIQRGRPVKVRFTLPIRFRLTDGSGESANPPQPIAPAAPPRISPLTFVSRQLGSPWNAAEAERLIGPPRTGSRIKNGSGTLVYDTPAQMVEALTVVIIEGRLHSYETRYAGEEGRALVGRLYERAVQESGPPADNGAFSPEQLGEPRRLVLSPEAGTLRVEFVPDGEVGDELTEVEDIDMDRVVEPPPSAPEEEVEVYVVVEQEPELIGGLAELQRRVEYPASAMAEGIQGTVFVQFIVDEVGHVTDLECFRGHPLLCDAALAAVSTAEFSPGYQDGQPVKVRFSLPVQFSIE
ncbi:MAG: energy transducer TonB [Bacteroidota bacterium]